MGVGRIIDGEHWPADVVVGYLIGESALLGVHWLYPRVHVWLASRSPFLFWLATGKQVAAQAKTSPLRRARVRKAVK